MYKTVLKMWMKRKLSAPLLELRRKGYLIEKWNRYAVVIMERMKNNEENNCFEHACVLSFSLFVSLSFARFSTVLYRLIQFYSHSSLKWMDWKRHSVLSFIYHQMQIWTQNIRFVEIKKKCLLISKAIEIRWSNDC